MKSYEKELVNRVETKNVASYQDMFYKELKGKDYILFDLKDILKEFKAMRKVSLDINKRDYVTLFFPESSLNCFIKECESLVHSDLIFHFTSIDNKELSSNCLSLHSMLRKLTSERLGNKDLLDHYIITLFYSSTFSKLTAQRNSKKFIYSENDIMKLINFSEQIEEAIITDKVFPLKKMKKRTKNRIETLALYDKHSTLDPKPIKNKLENIYIEPIFLSLEGHHIFKECTELDKSNDLFYYLYRQMIIDNHLSEVSHSVYKNFVQNNFDIALGKIKTLDNCASKNNIGKYTSIEKKYRVLK
jgi:hypothetical protein